MCPKLFYVTGTAHLLHYFAMKVKSQFHDDQAVAKIKSATVENKTRHAQFATIGYPPQPVATPFLMLFETLPEVKAIVENFGCLGCQPHK